MRAGFGWEATNNAAKTKGWAHTHFQFDPVGWRQTQTLKGPNMSSLSEPIGRLYLRPMHPRTPGDKARAASAVELFSDLVFATAILFAGSQIHYVLGQGNFGHGVVSYLLVMFFIWWTWVNFAWLSSSFEVDDWLYRSLAAIQMLGVLVVAGGVEQTFGGTVNVALIGYITIRAAQIGQWARASRCGGQAGRAALIYAVGIAVLAVLWVVCALWVPFLALPLVVGELAVPIIAERIGHTPWHAPHITERYGLLTLIVLGGSLRAAAIAVSRALGDHAPALFGVAVLSVLVAGGMWWIYFWAPHRDVINPKRYLSPLKYGYLHYFIFAAAGAFAAAVEVIIDLLAHDNYLMEHQAGLTLSIPVGVFVVAAWLAVLREHAPLPVSISLPVAGVLIVLEGFLPFPFIFIALTVVMLVTLLVLYQPVPSRATEDHKSVEDTADVS